MAKANRYGSSNARAELVDPGQQAPVFDDGDVLDQLDADEQADSEALEIEQPFVEPEPNDEPEPDDDEDAGRPPLNASTATWAAYCIGLGATAEDLSNMTRSELIDLAGDLEAEPADVLE